MRKSVCAILLPIVCISLSLLPLRSMAFTVGEEREVGEKLLYTVRSAFEVIDDPDISQYITSLGEEVIGVAGIQFFEYHFFIIKNKEFNAFAAPSGLIFFHSGLIEKVDDENELISVLAHEIGHIAKRHISSRIGKEKKISIATMGMMLASLALGGGAATEALLAGSMAAGRSASLHFSRLDEEEADLLAYGWMKRMERNPQGQVDMLKTMRQIARYRSGMIPQYLLTHPNPEARLDYVQTLVASDREELQNFEGGDNFSFTRFKYRIMAETKDSLSLRSYYSSVLASSRANEFDIIMAKYGLSLLERAENNYETGHQLLQEVIDHFGPRNELMVDKGLLEFESGKTDAAYSTLSAAYDRDRTDMYAAFSLAKVSFHRGMLEKAQTLYQGVIFAMPDFAQGYFELGRLSAAQGKRGEPKYYLGKYHLLQGKLPLAKHNLETAMAADDLLPQLAKDARESLELIERLEK